MALPPRAPEEALRSEASRFTGGELGSAGAAPQTVEAWAREYILSSSLGVKLAPPPAPKLWEATPAPCDVGRPGRPPELRPATRGSEVPDQLAPASARAKLLHAFFHHELQAAELMCWALLRFADAEPEFRAGLLRICNDEIRHMNAYRAEIERLGFHVGEFAVRDWFWRRIPTCASKLEFVSVMSMGLEAANLEHAPYFGARLRAAGDERAAQLQDLIAREELLHVRFGVRWFARWTGGQSFEAWQAALPPPLTPLMMRGKRFDARARERAGMAPEFVGALERWRPET